jgi:hypothetical protein
MSTIKKKTPTSSEEIEDFLKYIKFELPVGFIEFFRQSNGAEIFNGTDYIILWPVTDMIKLNEDYNINEYADGFFLFGSDGGDTAYSIEKRTGFIFDMPFIGMSNKDAVFICKTFTQLLESVQ